MNTKLRDYYRYYQQYSSKVSEACQLLFIADIFILPGYAIRPLVIYAILNLMHYFIGMQGYSVLADKILKYPNMQVRSDNLRSVLIAIMYLKMSIIVCLNVTEIVLHLKL